MKSYWISILLWTLVIFSSFLGNYLSLKKTTIKIAKNELNAFFDQIVTTRAWNAMYGGVYVKVTDKVHPNPYLEDEERDLITTDSIHLTKINPAYMTRQISEIATKTNHVNFRITSLKPLQPKNKPDAWEADALSQFESGLPEKFEYIENDTQKIYKYMAPLYVKKSCLKCHAQQGYKIGQIRGGVSVTANACPLLNSFWGQFANLSILHFGVWLSGIFVIFIIRHHNVKNYQILSEKNEELALQKKELNILNTNLLEQIEERKQIQSELEQSKNKAETANKIKTKFLENMSHEIRTPLNISIGYTEILKQKMLYQPVALEYVDGIYQSNKNLLLLLDDILHLSKIDVEEIEIKEQPVNIKEFIENITRLFAPQMHEKEIELKLIFDIQDYQIIKIDPKRFRQVIFNIFSRLIRFMTTGEILLEIKTIKTDNQLNLTVDLTVLLVDKTLHCQLYEKFKNEINEMGRAGLGLLIAERFLRKLNGQLALNKQPNGGMILHIELNDVKILTDTTQIITTKNKRAIVNPQKEFIIEKVIEQCKQELQNCNNDVLAKFDQLKETHQKIRKKILLNKVKTFALTLKMLSEMHHLNSLKVYSEYLLQQTELIKIDNITEALNYFPDIFSTE